MDKNKPVIRLIVSILIVLLYCFPFVYFAMIQDFTNGSMFGYFILIIGTMILAFFSKYFNNTIPFIIGNITSIIISFYFLHNIESTLGSGWDKGYFKPLTPYQLLFLVSILNLFPQFIAIWLASKIKK